MKKTAEELYDMMIDAMPWKITERAKPYILELAEAFSTQQVTAATDGWRHDYKSVKSALAAQKRITESLQKEMDELRRENVFLKNLVKQLEILIQQDNENQ